MPLTVLSIAFLAVYAIPILAPGLPSSVRQACEVANIVIWAVFGLEYVIRLGLSGNRPAFVRTHWFDLLVLVLPLLRPLRALRLITALKVLNRRTQALTRGRLAVYVAATTVLITVVGALAALDAERAAPDSSINTYPEALWWAIVTITTVGYGDYSPVTVEGRLVALTMMIGGIGLIGFVTGSLASWIVERIAADESADDNETTVTRSDLAGLRDEILQLRTELAALRSTSADAQAPPDRE
ncbi:potassium channel family protein [Actinoplanes sp. TRM 88003]|uniref:Potassium channel family protein n=1 Tax=Paractinoplanes aksuensis TaxID=2939490 RepID=A0ABT1E3N1_9ACTN|nr:potassium channel family protein [Actinoplanes aksuensis]MCO8277657.1 potassium channel family protein [Actinoplanes aksuensis]